MEKEVWAPVVGAEGDYEVSTFGRVKSHKRGGPVMLSVFRGSRNYWHVNICTAGRRDTVPVHRLVAQAFIGPCPQGQEISHRNGDRSDNKLSNLLYETHVENCKRRPFHGGATRPGNASPFVKLRDEQLAEVFGKRAQGWTHGKIAAHFGVCRALISMVLSGKKRAQSVANISGQMVTVECLPNLLS